MTANPYWKAQLQNGSLLLQYSDGKGEPADGELERLVKDLHMGMPGYNVPQYFGSQPGIFHGYDHLVVAREMATGNTVGLFGARWFVGSTHRYLYFWTAMVTEPYRGTSLTSAMTLWTLEQASDARGVPDVVASKTYSPVVFRALASMADVFPGLQFYPHVDGRRQNAEMIALAQQLTAMLCPRLHVDHEAAIVYGGQAVLAPDFFPKAMPLSGVAPIDHYFARLTRDDQILVLLEIPSAVQPAFLQGVQAARVARFRMRRPS